MKYGVNACQMMLRMIGMGCLRGNTIGARCELDSSSAIKSKRLLETLKGRRTLLIVMQDFPDPDAIGAAAALRLIAKSQGEVTTTLACGGFVGRAENRALLKYLGLKVQSLDKLVLSSFEGVAMVDTQPGAGNNALDVQRIPDIVVDHHPIRNLTRKAEFYDVRKRYGATSTLFYEYLRSCKIPVSTPLATALLYGIRSDTADFGRESTQADIEAFLALYPSSNKRMLGRIAMARVPRVYFRAIAKALNQACSAGDCVFTYLESVDNPDSVSEAADLLLRDEETNWSLCVGKHNDNLLLSLRTSDITRDAGRLMQRLVGTSGTGGGHVAMAGGQIPLKQSDDDYAQAQADRLFTRFLKILGAKSSDLHRLIEP